MSPTYIAWKPTRLIEAEIYGFPRVESHIFCRDFSFDLEVRGERVFSRTGLERMVRADRFHRRVEGG